jgi:hypothetical protein
LTGCYGHILIVCNKIEQELSGFFEFFLNPPISKPVLTEVEGSKFCCAQNERTCPNERKHPT